MRLIGALSHGSKVTPLHIVTTLIDKWPSNGLTMNHLTLNKIWLLISLKKSLLLVITEGNSIFILSWDTIGSGPIFSFFRDLRTRLSMQHPILYWSLPYPMNIRRSLTNQEWYLDPSKSSNKFLQQILLLLLIQKYHKLSQQKSILRHSFLTVASNSDSKTFNLNAILWVWSNLVPWNVITNLMFTDFKIVFMRFSLFISMDILYVT